MKPENISIILLALFAFGLPNVAQASQLPANNIDNLAAFIETL